MRCLPFIVGCERSGTTLLQAMLNAHPQLAVPGESYFIPSMFRQRWRYGRGKRFRTEVFLRDLFRHPRVRRWHLDVTRVQAAMATAPPSGLADAIRNVYEQYALQQGKPRYADKTPAYVEHIPLLARLFDESVFVHLARDGRDVALSLRDHVRGQPDGKLFGDVALCALHWHTRVRRGRRAGAQLGPERYLEVRYETLVREPEATLWNVARFLGLPYDSAMLRYRDGVDEISRAFLAPNLQGRLHLPPTPGLRNWREEMTREEQAAFEAVAGKTLEAMGYGRSTATSGNMLSRAGLHTRFLADRGRRGTRRLLHYMRTSE